MDLHFEAGEVLRAANLNTMVSGITTLENGVVLEKGTGTNSIVQKGGNNAATGLGGIAQISDKAAFNTNVDGLEHITNAGGSYSVIFGGPNEANAKRSMCIGGYNVASGHTSLATGEATKTTGRASATFGQNTQANGTASIATGFKTIANAPYSIAVGSETQANGQNSIAEGNYSQAIGGSSHAEGYNTKATSTFSHAEGIGTNAGASTNYGWVEDAEQANYSKTISTEGTVTVTDAKISGGFTINTEVVDKTINVTIAPAPTSSNHALFRVTYAISGVEPGPTPPVTPSESRVIASHTEGYGSQAYLIGSHAEGALTAAIGKSSHAEGNRNISFGENSHTEGRNNTANGDNSHVGGLNNTANYDNQTVIGYYNYNKDETIFEIGNGTALGKSNALEVYKDGHVEIGEQNYTKEKSIVCLKYFQDSLSNKLDSANPKPTGVFSMKDSLGNVTFKLNPGSRTIQFGLSDSDTGAKAAESIAAGFKVTANGIDSIALGNRTIANGQNSIAEGLNTITNNANEHAEGSFNVSNSGSTEYGNSGNTQHSVGIGTSTSTRKNAFEIMQNGDIYIYGKGGYDGTNAGQDGIKTLQQLLTDAGI